MTSNEDENFRHLIGGNFSPIEAQLGQEAYQSQVEVNKAHTELLHTQAELARRQFDVGKEGMVSSNRLDNAKAMFWEAVGMGLTVTFVLVILFAIPVMVLLWRSVL